MLAELAEQGKLTDKFLPLTGELVFRVLAYWTVVAERRSQRPDIHLPFYHMRSDGCWTPLDENDRPTFERRRAVAEAAHIHQFADSRNNHPRNGIALCKNAHWTFDEELWSLDGDYRVLIAAKRFDESGASEFLLSHKAGSHILLPSDSNLWPDKNHLAWHRKRHGFEQA